MLVLFLDLVLPPSHPTPPRVNWKRPLLKSAQLWKAIFIDFKSKTKAVFLDDAGTGSGNSLGNAKGSKLCFVLSLGIWGQIHKSLPCNATIFDVQGNNIGEIHTYLITQIQIALCPTTFQIYGLF